MPLLSDTMEGIPLLREKKGPTDAFPCVPARFALAIWSFLGFINMFTLRMDLNIAILAMVNDTDADNSDNVTGAGLVRVDTSREKFTWSEAEQSLLLSAFYYGYCSTQILGGYISGLVGAKLLMGYSLLVTSLLALIMPVAAAENYYLLLACRVGQGITQGLAQPCMHTMWSKWAPDQEKSKLLAITFSGCQLGTVIASWGSGYLCHDDLFGGWPSVFYLFGSAGVIWSAGWLVFVHESPATHPRISQAEREYIENGIQHDKFNMQAKKTPWAQMLRSPALWAITFSHFANDWGCFALTTCLPSFLHHILKYDLLENGFLSALPYLILMVTNPLSGVMADQLRSRDVLSTKNTRKLLNSIGLFIPAVLMLCVPVCEKDRTLIVTLLTLAVGFSGFTMAGYSVNHLDIAPAYAGILYGITNTIGTTSGFIGPAIVGVLTNGEMNNTIHQWNIFFFLTAAVFFIGGLTFLLFAEGEPQSWGVPPKVKRPLKDVISGDSGIFSPETLKQPDLFNKGPTESLSIFGENVNIQSPEAQDDYEKDDLDRDGGRSKPESDDSSYTVEADLEAASAEATRDRRSSTLGSILHSF